MTMWECGKEKCRHRNRDEDDCCVECGTPRDVSELLAEPEFREGDILAGKYRLESRLGEGGMAVVWRAMDGKLGKARAVKIRGGSGNQLGTDEDNAPGRTEKLIRMTREMLGDDIVLMLDGNGSYSVKEAVRIGRLLEEYNYYFYEEPVPWDWYEEQKEVADTLDIKMAGGEEEFRMRAFRWLIAHDAFDIIQPDNLYFGGLIRSMKVAGWPSTPVSVEAGSIAMIETGGATVSIVTWRRKSALKLPARSSTSRLRLCTPSASGAPSMAPSASSLSNWLSVWVKNPSVVKSPKAAQESIRSTSPFVPASPGRS